MKYLALMLLLSMMLAALCLAQIAAQMTNHAPAEEEQGYELAPIEEPSFYEGCWIGSYESWE